MWVNLRVLPEIFFDHFHGQEEALRVLLQRDELKMFVERFGNDVARAVAKAAKGLDFIKVRAI